MPTRALSKLPGRLVVLAFVVAGCSGMTVETSGEPDWSPAGWHSYSWRPVPGGALGDPRVDEEYLVKLIRRDADAVLADKGYRKVDGAEADFQIGHWIALGTDSGRGPSGRTTTLDRYGRPRGYWAARGMTPATNIEKGTIGLYLVDPKLDKNVWRGQARAAVKFKADRETRRARVADAVRRILKELPAASQ